MAEGEQSTQIALFKGKKIRRIVRNNEWYFSVVDIIAALTDSNKPRDYWYRMKKREQQSSGVDLSTFCRQLKLPASDGKIGQKSSFRRKLSARQKG